MLNCMSPTCSAILHTKLLHTIVCRRHREDGKRLERFFCLFLSGVKSFQRFGLEMLTLALAIIIGNDQKFGQFFIQTVPKFFCLGGAKMQICK